MIHPNFGTYELATLPERFKVSFFFYLGLFEQLYENYISVILILANQLQNYIFTQTKA